MRFSRKFQHEMVDFSGNKEGSRVSNGTSNGQDHLDIMMYSVRGYDQYIYEQIETRTAYDASIQPRY